MFLFATVALDVLMRVLDHDDHGVDHRAYGDRNAAERRRGKDSSHLRTKLYVRDLVEQKWNAIRADANRHLPQIVNRLNVSANAQNKFLFRHLDGTATDFAVAILYRHADVGYGKV